MDMNFPASGICLLDKPADWTSHDVVSRMRRYFSTKRVGHAGTLDPMATGMLVLGYGHGTKLLTFLLGLDKTYSARIRLGVATNTDDCEGEYLSTPVDTRYLSQEQIEAAMRELTGEIQQVPASVSAIKVNGKRAYALVRGGEEVKLAPRAVTVSEFALLKVEQVEGFTDLDVRVSCSSGTYIRSLARDLGQALDGVGGHLTMLRRENIGPFLVDAASPVPARKASREEKETEAVTVMALGEAAAKFLPSLVLSPAQVVDLGHGKPLAADLLTSAEVDVEVKPGAVNSKRKQLEIACLNPDGALVAIVEKQGKRLKPVLVIPVDARS